MPRRPETAIVRSSYPCCRRGAHFCIVVGLPEQRFGREHRCNVERRNIPWVVVITYEGRSEAGVELHRASWTDHTNIIPIGVSV